MPHNGSAPAAGLHRHLLRERRKQREGTELRSRQTVSFFNLLIVIEATRLSRQHSLLLSDSP
jgi:hypothetical protein